MDEIIAKLDEFIRERCDVGDDPEYDLDVNLFDTGFMDSMGAVETIMFAEQTFGVEISQKAARRGFAEGCGSWKST